MAESKGHSIKEKIIVGVVSAAVLGFLGWLGKQIYEHWTPIWSFATSTFQWFFRSTAPCPIWLLVLLALATCVLLFVSIRTIIHILKAEALPTWSSYTEDAFFGVLWRWQYSKNRICDPLCFCPADDTALVTDRFLDGRGYLAFCFSCETCNQKFPVPYDDVKAVIGAAKRQIDRKIRSGEFKTALADAHPKSH